MTFNRLQMYLLKKTIRLKSLLNSTKLLDLTRDCAFYSVWYFIIGNRQALIYERERLKGERGLYVRRAIRSLSPDHHRPSEETCKYVMVELQQQG